MAQATDQVEAEFLPNDRIAERDRYFLGWRHDQALWGNWRVGVNAQKVEPFTSSD